MKVTLKLGIFVGNFLNIHGYKVMISTFLLTDIIDYFFYTSWIFFVWKRKRITIY